MTLSKIAALSQVEVQQLAADWYSKLDVHAPLEEYIPMLAEQGSEMCFPEATVYGFDGFKDWYERVIGIFFDEVHTLKKVQVTPKGDKADVKVVVKWEASVWNPPAAKSDRITLDAYQTWVVQRSPLTGKAVIETYIVDSLDYYEGSARL
ncbi:MAG: hypothetical protein CLLPBCKN_004211 [Chroococcidiopsis cubana SAG 39.79]|jgi:sulfate adenylyltransferase subunit 1 (EFTu-like GTPase family)|uniref:SnoaL-like domain-containing protein n=2 Tax=Chroococcidiopsis TaxID=54298 RepID=K9TYL3_CHRTP|nr:MULTISPECIES: hypothetical protein [Chroococcidiopsis]PSB49823.1 hypothetical protein C7B80_00140 [Cyanosarcina cf. burmensis CCALA 770]AFY87670.1 hypothetical protein Chro_2168 [Chroococcidiopsis thermalis PCC 7203]MDZ4874815.1 hypothetical protein [Chroococcidiopsis cubana SAG 39.79]PSB65339.1 hypothetical protein C7B79_05795 [Chroococcidiopsis cubana CCALA 043]RUT00913.1 hypothetical protein DSM107010_66630 [Chroococcidiopsis cubana SAG 39.79]